MNVLRFVVALVLMVVVLGGLTLWVAVQREDARIEAARRHQAILDHQVLAREVQIQQERTRLAREYEVCARQIESEILLARLRRGGGR